LPYGFIPTLHRIGCGPLIRPPGTFSPLGEKAGMRGHPLHLRRLLQTGQATKTSSQRTNFPATISSVRALNGPCRMASFRPCTESGRPPHPPSGHLLPQRGRRRGCGGRSPQRRLFDEISPGRKRCRAALATAVQDLAGRRRPPPDFFPSAGAVLDCAGRAERRRRFRVHADGGLTAALPALPTPFPAFQRRSRSFFVVPAVLRPFPPHFRPSTIVRRRSR